MVVTADTIAAAQAQKSLHLAAHFLALLLGQLLTMYFISICYDETDFLMTGKSNTSHTRPNQTLFDNKRILVTSL